MSFRYERKQRFVSKMVASQGRTLLASGRKGHVQLAGFDALSDACGYILDDVQCHVRIMLLERHDQLWEHIRRDRGNSAHRDVAGNFTLEFVHATTGVTDRCQNLSRVLEQTTSRFG